MKSNWSELGSLERKEGNSKIPLEEGSIWFIEKGAVNLFSIDTESNVRTLLAHFDSQSMLFPITGRGQQRIAAITEGETQLVKIPIEKAKSPFQEDATLLNRWINRLARFYQGEMLLKTEQVVTKEAVDLDSGKKVSLPRALHPGDKEKVGWVEIQKGEVEFLGHRELSIAEDHEPFPLTYHGWIETTKPATLQSQSIPANWDQSLQLFHSLFLGYVAKKLSRLKDEEKTTRTLSVESEEKRFHQALGEMAAVLQPFEELRFYGGIDPLLLAMNRVGKSIRVTFEEVERKEEGNVLALVEKIAKTGHTKTRVVRLVGQWWKRDSGNLLAFYGDEATPCALIRRRLGYYELWDSKTGKSKRVTKEVAASLVNTAFSFYPLFPDEVCDARGVIRFFWKHHRSEFIPLFGYSFLNALFALFPPIATAILLTKVIPDHNLSLFWQVTGGLLGSAISAALFLYFRALTLSRVEGLASNQLQSAFWDRLLKLPASYFRKDPSGDLMMRVISIERMRKLLSGGVARALFSGIFALLYLLLMSIYSPILTLVAFSIIVVHFVLTYIVSRVYIRYEKKVFDRQGEINSFIVQIVSAVGKLRIAGAERSAFARWASQFAKMESIAMRSQLIRNLVTVMGAILPLVLYLAIFATLVAKQSISIGIFLAFNTAFSSFYLAMIAMGNTIIDIVPVFPLWQRIKVIITEPQEEKEDRLDPGELTGEILVDEVSFRYNHEGPPTLNQVHLTVHPKEFIGIVGPSGCGKSTLLRMLLGFEEPQGGAVYYGERNLNTLALPALRQQMGVVLQTGGIIQGSIYENLACGGNYTEEEVRRVLELSGFIRDLERLPMGLHTHLSMGGGTFSGGQRQRLLIARALLAKPKILLLDEATSALDNQNQREVTETFNQLEITRIVIAHRLNTLKEADRIYVMEKGEIVQHGSFEELANQEGLFLHMLKRQSL